MLGNAITIGGCRREEIGGILAVELGALDLVGGCDPISILPFQRRSATLCNRKTSHTIFCILRVRFRIRSQLIVLDSNTSQRRLKVVVML